MAYVAPAGTPAHITHALNDAGTYSEKVRATLNDILQEGQLEDALDLDANSLSEVYDLLPRDGWALRNAMREPSDQRQPPARKYELTEAQAELLFGLVKDHVSALQQYVVAAVEDENMVGAKRMAKRVREYQDLYALLNVQAHKMIDGRK